MKANNLRKTISINGRKFFYCFLFIAVLQLFTQINADAATFTVTNTNDSGTGSLRQAVVDANATTASDTITFNISGCPNGVCTIALTGGELAADPFSTAGILTITNPTGANNLIISGNNTNRIFFVKQDADLRLNDITLTNGNGKGTTDASRNGSGGAIFNLYGRLTVTNSNITRNEARSDTGSLGFGGGITGFGFVSITNSVISNNSATFGGIYSFSGTLFIDKSTISGNTGSGIYSTFELNLSNSTVSNNVGRFSGGIRGDGQTRITNSTISQNTAEGTGEGFGGGGIYNGGVMVLTNTTVNRNRAIRGGGIYNSNSGSTQIYTRNSIIEGNYGYIGQPDFYLGTNFGIFTSRGNNLIGSLDTNRSITLQSSDIQNVSLLTLLGNYGGATQTQALDSRSVAVNAGNNCVLTANGCGDNNAALATDQRGLLRNGNVDIGAFELQASETFSPVAKFDFDGDSRSDVSVFRPANGTWYTSTNPATNYGAFQFGTATDILVPADYDGDGKTDIAVYRDGTWYLQRSQTGFAAVSFGAAADIPVPADYDGDGKADVAVFRPSNGTWYLQTSNLGFSAVRFGQNGDKPVATDYDGDGRADIAVNRGGIWYIQRSALGFTSIQFGTADDKLIPADYDGDGKADIAVFRPSSGTWYLQQSTAGFRGVTFGFGTDTPVPGDYDGDGKADVAVFRNGTWYLNRTTQGFTGVSFGISNDKSVPNAFVQ